jgi:predicted nucleic acid-binding protein
VILVDTSVWVDHLNRSDADLGRLLEIGDVLAHPMVIGELSMGSIRNRAEVLQALDDLPLAVTAADDEVLSFIELRSLHGRGLNLFDATLLASVILTPETRLWTRDRRLREAAAEMSVSFVP